MSLSIALEFLKQLKKNNDRNWFNSNKKLYQAAKDEFEQFINMLIPLIQDIDSEVDVFTAKECMFRINRDIRFSNDKSPYKTNFGAYIARGGRKSPYAGYYVHLEPSQSFVGGGIYMPESRFLRAVRNEIYEHTSEYKKIISDQSFKKYFSEIYGDKLKTAPKGFPQEFEDIDLLRNKHYAVVYNVDDRFWFKNSVLNEITEIFKIQYRFNNFMNRAITKEI